MTSRKLSPAHLPEEELFFGHKGCAGCGGSVALRLALKVLGPRTFVVVPAGCMSAVSFVYPQMAFGCNAIISTFAGTASMLTGIAAGARALGLANVCALGFAGDGGTADIGLQALSGAIDREDRFIYICYDNEGYMNTGVQRSGLTPPGARTTTSPAAPGPGAVGRKKCLFDIVAAHGGCYAATASVGYPHDYLRKVDRARLHDGPSFIHVLAPCPTGWGSSTDRTVELGRLAVDSGLWFLAEHESGRSRLNRDPKAFTPIREYLAAQARFRHLSDAQVASIEADRDERWRRMRAWPSPSHSDER